MWSIMSSLDGSPSNPSDSRIGGVEL